MPGAARARVMNGRNPITASLSTTKGNVWIGGNGGPDSQILKFTQDGKFLMQYRQVGRAPKGGRGRRTPMSKPREKDFAADSNDPNNFGRVAKIFVDAKENEAYIADGYLNHRVAVIDADTGKMKRWWGAYGNKPDDTPLGPYDPAAAACAAIPQSRCTAPTCRSTG